MKDEIKEILDKIKKQLEADEGMGFEIAKDFHKTTLNYKEIKLLLDYITNLQTIEQQYSAILSENAKLENKITNLQNGFKSTVEELCETTEKFEKLQEKYEKMKENAEILSKGYSDLEKRNEKAIEYINKNKHLSMFADCREPEEDWNYDLEINPRELLNILQGSDKDE